MSEILVIGGNGFVGRHLVPALQDRGNSVRVLALPTEDTRWLEAREVVVHTGDIREPDTLAAPMHGVERVVHLAGMMGVWRPMEEYYAVNVSGTKNVCRAVLAAKARLVHVSSWTVYGMSLGRPVREDFALKPLPEPYSITKAAGDRAVQRMINEDRLRAVIVRPGTIFGPGDQLNFGRTADRLIGGRRVIVGKGNNAVPFVFVTDVVQGLLLALENDDAIGQAYNIANDRPLTQQQLLNAIAHEIGAKPPRLHVPYRALYAAAYAAERIAMLTRSQRDPLVTRHGVALFGTDNRHVVDKARRQLGYEPRVDLGEGVRLAAEWYRRRDREDSAHAAGIVREGV
ncbi:MAG: NAD-dependent epimerase/dehydratase family protein [Streptosporangiaceae bacterium]|nr:NAD-dependent epimerase/dehydratase family protein [Streptosporangiaceae bacterium]